MASVFKALSDPTRLKIISLLTESQNLCVNVIAEKTGMSQPAISQHLKVLKSAGFLDAKKMGMHVHYSINQQKAAEFKEAINVLFKKKPEHNCTDCPKNIHEKKSKSN
jgi:DNA-binding transcriptional ArsR family regulator